MADDAASSIAKEAKTLQQGLKEQLNNKSLDPWDREVEFQRKNLQKQYLLLLLNHPYAKESKDTEAHLWMQTSYALIAIYKQRIGTLERALREAGTQRQQGRQQRHGPVEHRKLLQRFKQFLANEEKFWTQLVVRYQRQFALTEAAPALAALNLTSPADADADHDAADNDGHRGGPRPSHFRFPQESTEPHPPPTTAQRASRLTTLSKALVCLGDLARYREQYQEGSGRRQGQDDGSKRGGRNRRQASAETAKAKTYDKARACYERARNLVPDEGNASHQLAILASYQKDTFESLVHYHRALCVRVSYEPAADNMGNVLSKFLSSWKARRNKSRAPSQASESAPHAKSRINNFKDDVVALHALWRLGTEGMDSVAPSLGEDVVKEFSALVSERSLPVDVVTKIMVLAQGALWKRRQVRAPSASSSKKTQTHERTASSSSDLATELRIATHLLSLYRALLDIGTAESNEFSKFVEDDLAMRITATFRRTLPALRISGKWLRANLNYVLHGPSETAQFAGPSLNAKEFWSSYTSFATCIAAVFPPSRLPQVDIPLEEDVELGGFLPLGGLLGTTVATTSTAESANGDAGQTTSAEPRALEQVHPNEEQLMRVWDIWHDADLVAKTPDVPMHSFRTGPQTTQPPQAETVNQVKAGNGQTGMATDEDNIWEVRPRVGYVDDDARTETTDPVGDAFRKALDDGTEDEEQDEIVWNPRPSLSPTSPYGPSNLSIPLSNPEKPINPIGLGRPNATSVNHDLSQQLATASLSHLSSAPPARSNPITHTPKTTAQDLLANVMGNRPANIRLDMRPRRVSHASPTSLPTPMPLQSDSSQPHLLFGGNSSFGSANSIWAASPDEGALGVHQRHRSHSGPFHLSLSKPPMQAATQALGQGPWSSQFDHRNMMSPTQGMMPLSVPNSGIHNGVHRRAVSSLVGPADAYLSGYNEPIGQISNHHPAPPGHALSPIGDPSQYAFTTLPAPNTPFSSGPPLSVGASPMHGIDNRAYHPYGGRGLGYNNLGQKMGSIWGDAG